MTTLEKTCDCSGKARKKSRKHIHDTTTIEDITFEETVGHPKEIKYYSNSNTHPPLKAPWSEKKLHKEIRIALNNELGSDIRFKPMYSVNDIIFRFFVNRLNTDYDVDETMEEVVEEHLFEIFSGYDGHLEEANIMIDKELQDFGKYIAATRWILDKWDSDDEESLPSQVHSYAKKARGLPRDSQVNNWAQYRFDMEFLWFPDE